MNRLNLGEMRRYRSTWPWDRFKGSAAQLKWSFRDLRNLDVAISMCTLRRTVVQAGGNLGIFPKRLAECFETVLTFEPDPKLCRILKHNAPEPNITVTTAALGDAYDSVGVATCRRDGSNRPVHEGLTHIAGGGDIPQVRVDDLRLKDCDLLYLDIEGYELNALRGAELTIDRCRPVIGVEVNRNISYYGATAEELRGWLRRRGYSLRYSCNSDEIYRPC